MKHSKILAAAFLAASTMYFSACGNAGNDNANEEADTNQQAPISINAVEDSPQYPDATLTIKDVKTVMQGTDSVKVTIDYGVANYELKQQTADAGDKACNNSKDGQHIHFILDNAPYAALYEPTHSFVVPVNSTHYVMSFLSRSYHESVKAPNAGILYHFSIDEKGKLTKLDNPETPMIFYSRPKGEYLGDDTKNLLLDFYVYNTTLSPDGNKVKATINGNEFTIDHWQPYFIQHAPMGDLTVQVQLTDQSGATLTGDNTSVSRTVKLAESEPIK